MYPESKIFLSCELPPFMAPFDDPNVTQAGRDPESLFQARQLLHQESLDRRTTFATGCESIEVSC